VLTTGATDAEYVLANADADIAMNATLDIKLVHVKAFAELFIIETHLCSRIASRQLQPEALKPAPRRMGRGEFPEGIRGASCHRRAAKDHLQGLLLAE